MNKSPTRRSRRIQSPATKYEAPIEERKRSRSRSRSRGRQTKPKERARPATKKSKSPSRASVATKIEISSVTVAEKPKLNLLEREGGEVVRNSISRFDDIASEAVITLRKTAKIVYSNKEAEIEEEVTNLLKENNVDLSNELRAKDEETKGFEKEFGGILGVLILIPLITATVVILQLAFIKENRSGDRFFLPLSWKKYFDVEASLYYVAFLLCQFILSSLPIGFHAHSTSGKYMNISYRCNGLVSGALTLGALYGLKRIDYFSPIVVLEKSLHMCNAAIITNFVLTVALHLFGTATNPKARSGSAIYDFWVGRQLSPRIGPLDVKLALIRASLISTIVQSGVLLLVECEKKTDYMDFVTSSVIANVLQCFYALDFLMFESSYLNTFIVQHEGAGYMLIISLALYPFFITTLPKYLYYNDIENSPYTLGAVVFFFLLGYILFRLSNFQKSSFKTSSHPLQISGVEVVMGADGRKLLAGGTWGKLRHPNHLGVVIMNLSLLGLVIGGPLHWAPFLPPLITTLCLGYRSRRDSHRCAYVYGPAWQRYANKVNYDLIPGVF